MKQGGLLAGEADPRMALEARWFALTRDLLPGLAKAQGWPIHLDHCFMRVCLDAAFGAPWTATLRRPAIRHMTDAQLAAVAVAEDLVARPETLPVLDALSRDGRRDARTVR